MYRHLDMRKGTMTSREAAAVLGVTRETIYAYVSRGLIRSEPSPTSRQRQYLSEDVHALRHRKEPTPVSGASAVNDLHWVAAVFETAISTISEGNLIYRGYPATALAGSSSLETVARILWDCESLDPFDDPSSAAIFKQTEQMRRTLSVRSPVHETLSLLHYLGEADLGAYSLDKMSQWRTGVRAMRIVTAGMTGSPISARPMSEQLARHWGATTHPARDLLRAALVLCAEHEANTSSFVVRCIASTRTSLYHAVAGGMSAVQGPEHAGIIELVHLLFDEVTAAPSVEEAIVRRLRRGQTLPSFNHPLYPEGDPRADWILRKLAQSFPDHPELCIVQDLVKAAETYANARPMIYFALVALQRILNLPNRSSMILFAAGRTAGWVAHALEQYGSGQLIRPRARYVGSFPDPADTFSRRR
jgi:citrate synthase